MEDRSGREGPHVQHVLPAGCLASHVQPMEGAAVRVLPAVLPGDDVLEPLGLRLVVLASVGAISRISRS